MFAIEYLDKQEDLAICFQNIAITNFGDNAIQWVGNGIPMTLLDETPSPDLFFKLINQRAIQANLPESYPNLAYSFHFTAPWSLAIVASFWENGHQLYQAHYDALMQVLQTIISHIIKPEHELACEAIESVGVVIHASAENNVPMINSRIIIANLCKNDTNHSKRLSVEALSNTFETIHRQYHDNLHQGVKALGYATRITHQDGYFEIDDPKLTDEKLNKLYQDFSLDDVVFKFKTLPA